MTVFAVVLCHRCATTTSALGVLRPGNGHRYAGVKDAGLAQLVERPAGGRVGDAEDVLEHACGEGDGLGKHREEVAGRAVRAGDPEAL